MRIEKTIKWNNSDISNLLKSKIYHFWKIILLFWELKLETHSVSYTSSTSNTFVKCLIFDDVDSSPYNCFIRSSNISSVHWILLLFSVQSVLTTLLFLKQMTNCSMYTNCHINKIQNHNHINHNTHLISIFFKFKSMYIFRNRII